MNVYELLVSTLEVSGVDVYFNKYDADSDDEDMPPQYIAYFEMLNQGEQFADDNETATGHYFQVNIFSTTNYNTLVKTLNENMKAAGFVRRYGRDMPYDKKTGYYNRVQRYFYNEEVG